MAAPGSAILLGTIGAGLIVWLSLLGIRKRAMTRGRWSLKAWTSAHVYLGLALIVIGTLHTGFQFGWNVHTLAYVLMMLVILSGIYGISVYGMLPQGLSDSRSEMTGPQMIEAVNSLDKQIQISAQPLSDEDSAVVIGSLGEDPFGGGVWRRLSGSYPRCGNMRRAAAIMRARHDESHGQGGAGAGAGRRPAREEGGGAAAAARLYPAAGLARSVAVRAHSADLRAYRRADRAYHQRLLLLVGGSRDGVPPSEHQPQRRRARDRPHVAGSMTIC